MDNMNAASKHNPNKNLTTVNNALSDSLPTFAAFGGFGRAVEWSEHNGTSHL